MRDYEKLQNIINVYKPERGFLSWLNCCATTPPAINLDQSQFIDGIKGVAQKLNQGEQVCFGDFRGNTFDVVKSQPSDRSPLIPAGEANREAIAPNTTISPQTLIVQEMPEEHRDTIIRLFLHAIYNYLDECLLHNSNIAFCQEWKSAFEHVDNFGTFIKTKPHEENQTFLGYIDNFGIAIRERLPLYRINRTVAAAAPSLDSKTGTGPLPLPHLVPGTENSAASPAHISTTYKKGT